MNYIDSSYRSPLGPILLAADETGLTGLWFSDKSRYYAEGLRADAEELDGSSVSFSGSYIR